MLDAYHAASASSRACGLLDAYQDNGALSALMGAITLFRAAVAASPDGDPGRAALLCNLGTALQVLAERTGDAEALAEAVRVGRAAVAASPDGDPERAALLHSLGNALLTLAERTGDTKTLAQAVRVGRAAVTSTPNGHPHCAMFVGDLGNALLALAERTGDMTVLAEAIQALRDAVAASPDDHRERAMYLGNLGNAFRVLAERTGDAEALAEAVRVGRAAVAGTPDGHPDCGRRLNGLGNVLVALAERTGDMTVLAEAIQALRDAVAASPDDHPERAMYLGNLGTALRVLAERTGDAEALAGVAEALRDAVAASPDGYPERGMRLLRLGNALLALAERTGDMTALAEGVEALRDAVAASPDGHPDRVVYLTNLGNALLMLAGRTGDTETLAEAVRIGRAVVAETPDGHSDRAAHLNNLGSALQMLARRTGDTRTMAEAAEVLRAAVAASPAGHPHRGKRLGNLGGVLQMLAWRTGDAEALAEGVEVLRDAVAAIPDSDIHRAMHLGNLGTALRVLAQRTGDAEALAEGVEVLRDAVAAIPDSDPLRVTHLNNLGTALQALAEQTGDTKTLAEAVVCFQKAGGSTTAAVPTRVEGWRNAVAAALARGAGGDALAAAEAAVSLLSQLTPRWLTRADREHRLGETGSLARVAAAAATAAGQPERAAELLEQARGVLTADTVEARSSDLTRLRETAPELAQEFEELRARLDAPDQTAVFLLGGHDGHDRQAASALADARREAQTAWDELVTRIRTLDGFAGFLAVPSARDLAAYACDGPIVLVYTSPARCDALILTDDPGTPVRLVLLTALTETAAAEQADRLHNARQNATDPLADPASRVAAQDEILGALAWIWDTITEPVLTALGHIAAPRRGQPWPRVWWSPVGILAYLPLHAAGHHSDLTASAPCPAAGSRTVLDRVISSYTPTVRSLAYARTRRPENSSSKTVIVCVPDAPGTLPLPGASAETKTLTRLLPDALVLASPDRDTVLAALPSHQMAHFACHGHADWNAPSGSRLILRDHRTAPLTVADISALHLTGGLAYLSACDTAVTRPDLADEALHITGAFHLAGYQHVIGTLWPINDALANDISADFYTDLTADGSTPPQASRSAEALHHAIRRLRARYPRTPTLWAAHTHTGA